MRTIARTLSGSGTEACTALVLAPELERKLWPEPALALVWLWCGSGSGAALARLRLDSGLALACERAVALACPGSELLPGDKLQPAPPFEVV